MKTKLFFLFMATLALSSCSKIGENNETPVVITGEYSMVKETSANVYGVCNQTGLDLHQAIWGVEYSSDNLEKEAEVVISESLYFENKFECRLKNLSSNTLYYYRAFVKYDGIISYGAVRSFTTMAVPEVIDMGLSVKWASCNLGANKPEELGGFYQWAGIEDVTSTDIDLNWSNCPYHSGDNMNTNWTKYIPKSKSSYWFVPEDPEAEKTSPDDKTSIEKKDDAAFSVKGDSWQIPSEKNWLELIENCIWVWKTRGGVNGYEVTSMKMGYSDKTIFIPVAGYRSGKTHELVNNNGWYWCSTLDEETPYNAKNMSVSYSSRGIGSKYRYRGLSIRPVKK